MICDRCLQSADVGEHGYLLCPLEPRPPQHGVIDDQLEGGPRRFETMGPDEPYIESKSQWKREVEARGLVNLDRHDRAYFQAKFRQHEERLKDTGRSSDHGL